MNNTIDKNKNEDMYKLYESYKQTLHNARKAVAKRQKLNADMREKYDSPFKREDYNMNKNDISAWNSMIGELEDDMRSIEMYLDFNDRVLLHRDYDNMKSMIYNPKSYEGEIPLDDEYSASIPDTTDVVCDVELQEEIVELLDEVLTQRQKQVVQMYFWEGMTQDKIAKVLGLNKQNISVYIQNSLEKLRNCIKIKDFIEI